MNKTNKIFMVFAITIVLLLSIFSYVNAAVNPTGYLNGTISNETARNNIKSIGNTIVGIVQVVGSIVSAVIILIIGIRYMTGSVEEKASYKKSMMPYFIGAVVVLAATNILKLIVNFATNI